MSNPSATEIPDHVSGLIARTMGHEGGTANDSADPGLLTKWGIASRYHPEVLDEGFSIEDARRIYYADYYLRPQVYKLPRTLQPVMFDMNVNPGHPAATKILQRLVKAEPDGVLGAQTLSAVAGRDIPTLVRQLVEERILYYLARIIETPGKQKFAKGWIRRSLSYLT